MNLFSRRLFVLIAVLVALLGGTGAANAQPIADQDAYEECMTDTQPRLRDRCRSLLANSLMILKDQRGSSILVHCEYDQAVATVVIRDGEWSPPNGVQEGTACSESEFDARTKANVHPEDGWTIILPERIGGGLGAYACTNQGMAYAFVDEEKGVYSFEEFYDCSSRTMPG